MPNPNSNLWQKLNVTYKFFQHLPINQLKASKNRRIVVQRLLNFSSTISVLLFYFQSLSQKFHIDSLLTNTWNEQVVIGRTEVISIVALKEAVGIAKLVVTEKRVALFLNIIGHPECLTSLSCTCVGLNNIQSTSNSSIHHLFEHFTVALRFCHNLICELFF